VAGDIWHTHTQGGREVHTGFWWGNLKEKRPLGKPTPKKGGNINAYFE